MECEFNRTPYKRRLDNYSGHEHLTTSTQPSKYSESTLQDEVQKNLKTPSEVLGRLQYSATKSSGAYQTETHGTVHVVYFS
jgi:hypothetical protein